MIYKDFFPTTSLLAAVVAVALGAGCGTEIGDECTLSTDCSSAGDRICATDLPGGYCTVRGCDFDTCPDESICVRFFAVGDTSKRCDSAGETCS
ncbi:MAG: hypothetical protein AAGC55_26415, partial [Myxococcota bacterium]